MMKVLSYISVRRLTPAPAIIFYVSRNSAIKTPPPRLRGPQFGWRSKLVLLGVTPVPLLLDMTQVYEVAQDNSNSLANLCSLF